MTPLYWHIVQPLKRTLPDYYLTGEAPEAVRAKKPPPHSIATVIRRKDSNRYDARVLPDELSPAARFNVYGGRGCQWVVAHIGTATLDSVEWPNLDVLPPSATAPKRKLKVDWDADDFAAHTLRNANRIRRLRHRKPHEWQRDLTTRTGEDE